MGDRLWLIMTHEPNHRRLDLRPGHKHRRRDGREDFRTTMQRSHHRWDAVDLRTRSGCKALRHLGLHQNGDRVDFRHARENVEDQRRADVVRQIRYDVDSTRGGLARLSAMLGDEPTPIECQGITFDHRRCSIEDLGCHCSQTAVDLHGDHSGAGLYKCEGE